jgi:hypothetical protein
MARAVASTHLVQAQAQLGETPDPGQLDRVQRVLHRLLTRPNLTSPIPVTGWPPRHTITGGSTSSAR